MARDQAVGLSTRPWHLIPARQRESYRRPPASHLGDRGHDPTALPPGHACIVHVCGPVGLAKCAYFQRCRSGVCVFQKMRHAAKVFCKRDVSEGCCAPGARSGAGPHSEGYLTLRDDAVFGAPQKGGDSAESDLAHGVSAACLRESQSAIVLQSALVTFQRVGTHTYVRSRMRGADAGWLETKQKKLATGWRGRGRRFRAAARSRTSVSTPSPIGCATYTARGQRRTGQLQLPMAGDRNWRACVLAPSEEGGEEREEEKSEGKWATVRHPRHALTM